MAKLTRATNVISPQQITPENVGAAVAPGESLARAGESQVGMSRRLASSAQESDAKAAAVMRAQAMFQQSSKGADTNSRASSTFAMAATEYAALVSERIAKKTDENGQPLYGNLAKDTTQIAKEIKAKYGATLGGGDAAIAFNTKFDEFNLSNFPGVLEESRKQQLTFSKASTMSALNTLTHAAGSDNLGNYKAYEQQVSNLLRDGIADGTVSATEAVALQEQFRSVGAIGNINNTIKNDPAKAVVQLANSRPEDLGLTAPEWKNAVESANQALIIQKKAEAKEKAIAAEKEARAAEKDRLTQVKTFNANIKLAIANGDEQGANMALAQAGNIFTEAEYTNAQANIINGTKQLRADRESNEKILSGITAGTSLADVKPSELDKAYNDVRKQAAKNGEDPITAEINFAQDVKGAAVPAFVNSATTAISDGDAEAGYAYAQGILTLRKTNPNALKGVSKDTEAAARMAVRLVEGGKLAPAAAMEQVRDKLIRLPDDEKKTLMKNAKAASKDLDVADILDNTVIEASDFIPFYPDTSAEPGTEARIRRTFEDHYVANGGNVEDAVQATRQEIGAEYGPTDLTRTMQQDNPRDLINIVDVATKTVIRKPPESIPGLPQNPSTALRQDLGERVNGHLPEGYSVDDVGYEYADLSKSLKSVGVEGDTEYYKVYVIDRTTKERVYLTNDTGRALFWPVSPTELKKKARARALQQEQPK